MLFLFLPLLYQLLLSVSTFNSKIEKRDVLKESGKLMWLKTFFVPLSVV